MYKDTVTLFNRERNQTGDIWHPHILRNVNLNMDKGAISKLYGPESTDNAVLNVQYEEGESGLLVGELLWLPPKEWQLSDFSGITFASGNAFDFFFVGEWKGTASPKDEDYGDLSFYEYMTQQHDFVFAITSVGFYSVIPHFEVMGR